MPIEEIFLDPEPGILIESLRDIGYSFNSALADIIDNSVTAGATTVKVFALPGDGAHIAIVDNGKGLSPDNLFQAMKLGSTDPRQKRALNDLGRFGLGLKTASFSQCRRLTVASKHDGVISAFTWDLDNVVASNSWKVIRHSDPLSIPYVAELDGSGTLVLWEKIDRVAGTEEDGDIASWVIPDAQDYLSLVFHRFISGEQGIQKIAIFFNGLELSPIDPFNLSSHATQQAPAEQVCPGVTMQAFTLPPKDSYATKQEFEKYGLQGGYLKNQGVYLYRAKRLILYGTWFGLAKKTALTQLSRVRIDITTEQDEAWKIDVKKVSAQLPVLVRKRLKSLITQMGAPSKRVYRKKAVRLTSSESYPVWSPALVDDRKIYQIERTHPVISNFRESIPEEFRGDFDAVVSLVEAAFPTAALFYDISNDVDSVEFADMGDAELATNANTFFSSLKQAGMEEEDILGIMKCVEPFSSRWEKTLSALGITEE